MVAFTILHIQPTKKSISYVVMLLTLFNFYTGTISIACVLCVFASIYVIKLCMIPILSYSINIGFIFNS